MLEPEGLIDGYKPAAATHMLNIVPHSIRLTFVITDYFYLSKSAVL